MTAAPGTSLCVLIVSDIHAGASNIYQELRPPGSSSPPAHTIHANLASLTAVLESLAAGVESARRVLVCSGDISTACHSDEVACAASFLESLANKLSIP